MLTVVEYNHDDDKKRQPQNNHRLFGHCFHCLPTELLVLREVGELRKRFVQESLLDLQKSVVTCRRRPALWEIQMRRSTPNIHKHFQSSPCAKLESNIFQPWLEQLSQVISKQRAVCWHVFGHGHPLGLALWSCLLHSTWKICCISNPSQCSAALHVWIWSISFWLPCSSWILVNQILAFDLDGQGLVKLYFQCLGRDFHSLYTLKVKTLHPNLLMYVCPQLEHYHTVSRQKV